MATVSFIQPSVEDAFMEELLGAFGAIKSWRRPRDPKTNAPKSFGFVEYAHPESMTLALKVLPDKDVDGKGLQIQATKPTKEYLAWWGSHGRRGGANGAEDGEAAGEADEEAKEMEAMEKVMDIIMKRESRGGGRGGGRDATDRLIDSVSRDAKGAKPGQRRSRQEMLEAEFEADRKRKDAQTSEEARRERRALDDALARVARLERAAKRERRDRADLLKRDAEKRARAMKLDNEVSDDEGEGAAAARRSARGRAERLAEKERDEADALRELEEQATTSAGGDEGGGVKMEEEDLKKDAVFQAMIQESKLKPAAAPKEEEDKAEDTGGGGGGGGGWATVGVAGGWDNGGAGAAAAPRAPTAAKRALFDDGSAEDARKQAGAQWMLQAKAARAAAAEPGAVSAAGAPAPGSREAFVAERDQLMRQIPATIDACEAFPLDLPMLHLDRLESYQACLAKVVKYVHDVIPEDEEEIARAVLKIIREGGKAHAVLDFVRSFMDRDAEHFALRCMRSMIAESEIAKLRRKHNVAASARV